MMTIGLNRFGGLSFLNTYIILGISALKFLPVAIQMFILHYLFNLFAFG